MQTTCNQSRSNRNLLTPCKMEGIAVISNSFKGPILLYAFPEDSVQYSENVTISNQSRRSSHSGEYISSVPHSASLTRSLTNLGFEEYHPEYTSLHESQIEDLNVPLTTNRKERSEEDSVFGYSVNDLVCLFNPKNTTYNSEEWSNGILLRPVLVDKLSFYCIYKVARILILRRRKGNLFM